MNIIITFSAILAVSLAASVADYKNAQILKYDSDVGVGGYNFAYETSDGVSRQEQAELKNVGQENEAIVVRGTVSWIGADGQRYTLSYTADELGFHPEGAHLPRA